MGKLALRVAFVAAGLNYTILKLGDVFHRNSPLFMAVALCLPAVIVGSMSWWAVRSFAITARGRLYLDCLVGAGLGDPARESPWDRRRQLFDHGAAHCRVDRGEPMLVDVRKIYVFANAFALGLALWFEYQAHGIKMLSTLYRFGFLMNDDGTMKLANPNVVGGQLAFAAVLAFILHLRTGARANPYGKAADRPRRFSLAWTVFLSMGCALTASRGAFFAWLGGMLLLMFKGTNSQEPHRLRDLVAVCSVLLCVTLFAAMGTGFRPWGNLQSRLDADTAEVFTASGRVMIWQSALDTWCSSTRYFLFGAGTGAAPEALGQYLGITKFDGVTPGALDAHNAFVEWGLSYGLVGMVGGLCLLGAIFRNARRMDRRDGTVNRQAILACFCLASMTYVTFYQLFFVASGALILSMLSEVPATVSTRGPVAIVEMASPRE